MQNKERKPTKKEIIWVKGIINTLSSLFTTDDFELHYTFNHVEIEYAENSTCSAWVVVDLCYRRLHFNINPSFWKLDHVARVHVLIHELAHRVSNEQQSLLDRILKQGKHVSLEEARIANERETSMIEKITTRLIVYGHNGLKKKLGL